MNVIEVFQSIQGEGFNCGRLAVFIRFAGCNLRCSFCDTKYAYEGGKLVTPKEIIQEVNHLSPIPGLVVITGGEPVLQNENEMQALMFGLHVYEHEIAFETNGTMQVPLSYRGLIDWLTVSPKGPLSQLEGDELKLLYDGSQDLEQYDGFEFSYFYLQPILPEANFIMEKGLSDEVRASFVKAIDTIKAYPKWRLSAQVQKLIGVR